MACWWLEIVHGESTHAEEPANATYWNSFLKPSCDTSQRPLLCLQARHPRPQPGVTVVQGNLKMNLTVSPSGSLSFKLKKSSLPFLLWLPPQMLL